MEQKTETLTQQFNARPETEEYAQLTYQLNALLLRFDNLPSPPEPVDLSGIEAEIATLQAQLQGIGLSPIALTIAEIQTQIDQLGHQIQNLPPSFDPSGLARQLTELEKNYSTNRSDVERLISGVESLQSDKALTTEALARLESRLSALALWLDRFSNSPRTC